MPTSGMSAVEAFAEVQVLNESSGLGSTGEDDSQTVDPEEVQLLTAPTAVPLSIPWGAVGLVGGLLSAVRLATKTAERSRR